MDLKTGRDQGLREPRFLLPSLETSPFAPAASQHATRSCKGRKKQTYFAGNSEKEGEGDTRLYFRGSLALFRFQTSFQKRNHCFSLVPASPNMKPGHLNPHVNCKMLPSHPFRHCPFFRAKQHSLNNPMHHTSYFPSDT